MLIVNKVNILQSCNDNCTSYDINSINNVKTLNQDDFTVKKATPQNYDIIFI